MRIGEVDVRFYLMPNLADALIMGIADTARIGTYPEQRQADGRQWVQFTTFGIRLPFIIPQNRDVLPPALVPVQSKRIEGPDVVPIEVTMPEGSFADSSE